MWPQLRRSGLCLKREFSIIGITKTHNLTFQESESLQAVFSKELCPNLIVAQAKYVSYICLKVSKFSVCLNNFLFDLDFELF